MKVKIKGNSRYGDYKDGDNGFVHGYIRGGNDEPLAVVIIGKKFVLVPITSLRVDDGKEEEVKLPPPNDTGTILHPR